MTDLDIAEVALRAGVPASTLRFYEERGLIASSGRRGLRRQYDPGVLERLALIALGRTAGFSLDEIARMFAPDGRPRIDREMLASRAAELDRTIHELGVLRDSCAMPPPAPHRVMRNAPPSAASWRPPRPAPSSHRRSGFHGDREASSPACRQAEPAS